MTPPRVAPAVSALLAVLAAGHSSVPAAPLPPIPLFVDGFECGDLRPWSATSATVPPGPPVGIFRPAVSCAWEPTTEPYPAHSGILVTPLVADLPPGAAGSLEIVLVGYNGTDGGSTVCMGTSTSEFGVLRIIDAATCEGIAVVSGEDEKLIATATPAIGDLDGDGTPEIVALRARDTDGPAYGPVAFRWDPVDDRYERFWESTGTNLGDAFCRWDGPMLHDLDDDGFPEVISAHEVYDGRTGARLDDGLYAATATLGWLSVGDVDADGVPELVSTTTRHFDPDTGEWVNESTEGKEVGSTAYADFGTPAGDGLDGATLDGIAEIVRSTKSPVAASLERLDGEVVFSVADAGAGPPALGDFDGDGRPEIAVASGAALRVLDLDCESAGGGCAGGWVRWSATIQDLSSGRSSATAADLDSDGALEVVFADECWARVFDGTTGEVLASTARRSCTFSEGVAIADADRDGAADLVVGSNQTCVGITCPAVDPIQRGLRCTSDADCLSADCDSGYCRCVTDGECPARHACTAPPGGTPGTGDTCRADRADAPASGIEIVSEALGRWDPVGSIWNQQPFSVTNVAPDGTVPATSEWLPNFLVPGRNDFRAADALCVP